MNKKQFDAMISTAIAGAVPAGLVLEYEDLEHTYKPLAGLGRNALQVNGNKITVAAIDYLPIEQQRWLRLWAEKATTQIAGSCRMVGEPMGRGFSAARRLLSSGAWVAALRELRRPRIVAPWGIGGEA